MFERDEIFRPETSNNSQRMKFRRSENNFVGEIAGKAKPLQEQSMPSPLSRNATLFTIITLARDQKGLDVREFTVGLPKSH